MTTPGYEKLSFWLTTLPEPIEPRPALDGDVAADVAIVGAGYTGLWAAYYLSALDPGLRVVVLEAEVAGFGASGRNGGWCTGALAGIDGLLARESRREAGLKLQRAAFDAVDEVGRVAEKESIDCHYEKGGSLRVATSPAQREHLEAHLATLSSWGLGAEDYAWLEPAASQQRLRLSRGHGAIFTPHCAALHPARLVRGLADVVEGRGVRIFEATRALRIEPGRVVTHGGVVSARTILRATEAYTRTLARPRRRLLPLHSMMIATEPLDEAAWEDIGLRGRETFGDERRIVVYGQRTLEGRLAFGARGDYRFGSGIEDRFDARDARFETVHRTLLELLPQLEGVAITHRWGGALGVPRTWRPSVGLDRATGLGWAGGYVGQGVAAANLAGRTWAELVVDAGTERCSLPWVGRESRDWEPEPLRWLAVRAIARLGAAADRAEWSGRSSGLSGRIFDAFVAH
jgi:glycine/D-amino acid oxidase-like deaminating enzyme